jgi:hypothetical protein
MKSSHLLGLVTIALALSAQPSASAAGVARFAGAARSAHHLYVTTSSAILRYPFVHNRPAAKPDLTIAGSYGPIGVAPLGTTGDVLYAADGRNDYTIDAFPADGTRVDRQLLLPRLHGSFAWTVVALGVDSAGYLYVGASAYASGHAPGGEPFRLPRQGVFIYSPAQRGRVYPSAVINVHVAVDTITVDRASTLYIVGDSGIFNGVCDVYGNTHGKPTLLRSFTSPALGTAYGSAVNGQNVYINSINQTDNFVLTVFPTSSNGSVLPTSSFTSAGGYIDGPLAYYGGILYIEGQSPLQTQLFDANATGNVEPLSTLTAIGNPAVD